MQIDPTKWREIQEMASSLSGFNPMRQRRSTDFRILRHDRPWFGKATRTLETKPRGPKPTFARLEEDIRDDGFTIRARIFDVKGVQLVALRVLEEQKVNGVPFAQVTETVSDSPSGRSIRRTTCIKVRGE